MNKESEPCITSTLRTWRFTGALTHGVEFMKNEKRYIHSTGPRLSAKIPNESLTKSWSKTSLLRRQKSRGCSRVIRVGATCICRRSRRWRGAGDGIENHVGLDDPYGISYHTSDETWNPQNDTQNVLFRFLEWWLSKPTHDNLDECRYEKHEHVDDNLLETPPGGINQKH